MAILVCCIFVFNCQAVMWQLSVRCLSLLITSNSWILTINRSKNVHLPFCRFVRWSGQPVGHGELSRIAAGEECNSISIKIRRRVSRRRGASTFNCFIFPKWDIKLVKVKYWLAVKSEKYGDMIFHHLILDANI